MEIKCDYQENDWGSLGSMYTCYITSASITEPNQEIKDIIGQHKAGKTDRNVEAIWFNKTKVHFMPRGIGKIFPNLNTVRIVSCGLKQITREDLVGLENIEKLFLAYNELNSLPDDLLEGMKKLNWIIFSNNKLEFVSSQLLQPVLGNQLSIVSFRNNPTIDAVFNASDANPSGINVDLPGLMKLIDGKCKKPPKVEQQMKLSTPLKSFCVNFVRGFRSLLASGLLTDFTIIVGDQRFPVHKCVLAIQSEFFAETFKKAEGNSLTEFKIEDLSVEAVENVLRWMYTRQTPEVKNALEVFALVMKLKISGLKEVAGNLVLQKLNQKNAMEIFELGQRYKSENAVNSSFEEIKKLLNEFNLDDNLKGEPEKLKNIVDAKKNNK